MLVPLIIAAVVGYLLGSLPFGYLIARAKGVNIFEVGSKSSGATNVKRVLGAGPGNLVFFLDTLKGAVATAWPMFFFLWQAVAPPSSDINSLSGHSLANSVLLGLPMGVTGLVCAIIGHSYSCFTKFHGGKGVATATGGFLVLLPIETLIACAVWIIVFYASRYVSLASILAAVALPVASLLLSHDPLLTGLTAIIALFVIIRHRANIVRLLNGTENKFVKKKESGA